jgi:hypothetical protein
VQSCRGGAVIDDGAHTTSATQPQTERTVADVMTSTIR